VGLVLNERCFLKTWKNLLITKNTVTPPKVTRRFKWQFAGWFILLFSLLLCFWMAQSLQRNSKLSSLGVKTRGTVIEKLSSTREQGGLKNMRPKSTRFYQVTADYALDATNRGTTTVELRKVDWDRIMAGQQIDLILDPSDPTNVFFGKELPDGFLRRSFQALGLFLFTSLLGVITLIRSRFISN
jgi:hypothetical protein